jgi:hypothetical protein
METALVREHSLQGRQKKKLPKRFITMWIINPRKNGMQKQML